MKELLWTCMQKCPTEYVSLIAYIAYEIWFQRNAVIFNQHKFAFSEIITKAERRWWDIQKSGETDMEVAEKTRPKQYWEKPVRGTHKLNNDVAIWPDVELGWGLRCMILKEMWCWRQRWS